MKNRFRENSVPTDICMTIACIDEILPGIFKIVFRCNNYQFFASAYPGQFLQIDISSGPFPVTRRPLTISRLYPDRNLVEIVFEVVGRGTDILSKVEAGSDIQVLGPCGHGFELHSGKWMLIGGGLGAAGFPFLIDRVDCRIALIGASTADKVFILEGIDSDLITEDGTLGRKGLVTKLMHTAPWDIVENVAVCGPVPMMKAVIENIPVDFSGTVQISTEAHMGCGWGVCEGCAILLSDGTYAKCCTDGPVFYSDMIDRHFGEGTVL